ncbi:flagellar protein FlaG [Bordetella genomosp. 9]|uniref:Flagellar protein n=1 Tax=Bordetella genomosp. 9 TaxID=1416803 RepID=A0A1W6Z0L7_9BORD|nr:flagellar protein FlaG [Bordetella genomosp. 9]ARP86917.1 flagellar protein [Bordetella genomosp. 9]ARP90902.1 flagellar protein [Bordetella genomosp. 9]
MAVSPIAPAALPVQPPEVQPVPVPDAAVQVTPAADSQKGAGTGGATADGGGSDQPSSQDLPLDRALKKINEQMEAWSTQVQFDIDPDTKRVVISIKDARTGDVIKKIPSETVLNIAKMITRLQGGGVETSA